MTTFRLLQAYSRASRMSFSDSLTSCYIKNRSWLVGSLAFKWRTFGNS